ncbi:MAG: hypothetical protein F9K30_13905 [Dechloromonas sp.]|nr:MAG: hypothetical protein F9K30_13905 [Dechloromonas sp.]
MEAAACSVQGNLFLTAAAVVALANLENSQRRQRFEKKWRFARDEIVKTLRFTVFSSVRRSAPLHKCHHNAKTANDGTSVHATPAPMRPRSRKTLNVLH